MARKNPGAVYIAHPKSYTAVELEAREREFAASCTRQTRRERVSLSDAAGSTGFSRLINIETIIDKPQRTGRSIYERMCVCVCHIGIVYRREAGKLSAKKKKEEDDDEGCSGRETLCHSKPREFIEIPVHIYIYRARMPCAAKQQ